ncbi:hypothetical protein [Anaerococcus prevotii]|uniref:Uncharacterized protein n=1 Tax=Anaerococcus prevotii ACS-065-V-Col13 TaxID=879305 RepID=F0GWM0_9FIRM|nr:hypothetical protein [Anaerococcus prevotii]EGC81878.1 hypothetical protein HMPREF9290_0211 [Anaerococcus prevotii ACS-065-V-Col13]
MEDLKIEKEFIYNKIYERMSIISGRRKLIKKTIPTKIRTEKFLAIKKTIAKN